MKLLLINEDRGLYNLLTPVFKKPPSLEQLGIIADYLEEYGDSDGLVLADYARTIIDYCQFFAQAIQDLKAVASEPDKHKRRRLVAAIEKSREPGSPERQPHEDRFNAASKALKEMLARHSVDVTGSSWVQGKTPGKLKAYSAGFWHDSKYYTTDVIPPRASYRQRDNQRVSTAHDDIRKIYARIAIIADYLCLTVTIPQYTAALRAAKND